MLNCSRCGHAFEPQESIHIVNEDLGTFSLCDTCSDFWIKNRQRLIQELERNTNMNIGSAVERLKTGERVRREGWNGKGMFLELQFSDPKMTLPYVFMSTVQGDLVPWLCSQTDLLANDWEVVKD